VRDFDVMWEAAGGRVSGSVDRSAAVAVLGDDPAATGAVALGIARAHAMSRRVFVLDLLGDGQGITAHDAAALEAPGVSDMVHYGVSLGRAARAHRDTPNLFLVPGGAESPLSDEVLTHRWWAVTVEQIRRANALLLVAAPAMVPAIGAMVRHMDGMLLVGEALAPAAGFPVLAEVRAAATMRSPTTSARVISPPPPPPSRARWRAVVVLGLLVLVGAAWGTFARWSPLAARLLGNRSPALGEPVSADIALPEIPESPSPPTVALPETDAAYSVELLFTNSWPDALAYLAQYADSLPATTIAIHSISNDSDRWYRILAGAFADSAAAEAYMTTLQRTGRLSTGAGLVVHTPFALVLDSAASDALAQLRVAAFRGRGIPAYALRDSASTWRVFAGAFATQLESALLKQQLDSLNIQSALVTRAGSTP
jgi:SPOR domain